MRRPFPIRRLLWLIPLLALLGVAWQVAGMRGFEESVLARAQQHFQRRELEAALEALQPFTDRRMVSSPARRRAALLFFQLGEDRQAHRMLLLQRPDDKSEDDRTLQEWSARCQRAQNHLNQADKLKDPQLRREHVEAALAETPDAPGLIRRLVEEDLVLMSVSGGAAGKAAAEQFARDYMELRSKAPKLAAAVKAGAERSLEKMER